MKKVFLSSILFVTFLYQNVNAAVIDVDGNVVLDQQSNHSGIQITFERVAPSALTYSTSTNSSGNFSINIETGIYNIKYKKNEYFEYIIEEKALYSSATLTDVTLIEKTTLINVPDTFPTIQSAINAASNGDTVLVAPGTYYENINFNAKNITVASYFLITKDTTYISQTIVDGNQNGRVVEFSSGEDSTAVLSGFTITNGNENRQYPEYPYWGWGGGIYCDNSSPYLTNLIICNNISRKGGGIGIHRDSYPVLTNLTIINNSAIGGSGGSGGGIFCRDYSSITLNNINISNNTATGYGGGIYFMFSSHFLTNVIISYNEAGKFGGGICCDQSSTLTLKNVNINNNSTESFGGGIYCMYSSNPNLINCIVTENKGNCGIYIDSGTPYISHSSVCNNENGNFYNCGDWIGKNITTNSNGDSCDAYYNIQLNPQFLDEENSDYHLLDYSPCIGAGTSEGAPVTDIEDNTRGTPPDIGAYENILNSPLPIHPPTVITTSLPNATQDVQYSEKIHIEDPDEEDSFKFQLLDAPEWLSIDNLGILSGTPNNDDVGNGIQITIQVTDSYGLTDKLSTTIDAINVLDPPFNFSLEDIPNDQGHRLKLKWDLSPDDEKGYVTIYRIYRSRSDVLTEPIPLSQFTSLDSLKSWEEHYTIIIDSIGTGITEYIDECVPVNGVLYYYWLQSVGTNGESEKIAANAANIVTRVDEKPTTFVLHPAYPNPFNPTTTIQFEVNEKIHVRMVIYDILGREIAVLQNSLMGAGLHEIVWNGRNKEGTITGSGVYVYKIIAGSHSAQGKILFLR